MFKVRRKMTKDPLFKILAVLFMLPLGACGVFVAGVAAPSVLKQEKVNVTNASHAAADILAQQSSKKFDRQENLLVVSDLQEIVDTSQKEIVENPQVGKLIAGQMRTRFLELGYNIFENVNTQGSKSTALVTGTYSIRGNKMQVYVRMTNQRTGEVIGIHEYSLPITYDIKKYMTRDKNGVPPMPHII